MAGLPSVTPSSPSFLLLLAVLLCVCGPWPSLSQSPPSLPQTQVAFLNAYVGAGNIDFFVGKTRAAYAVPYGSFSAPLYTNLGTGDFLTFNVSFTDTSGLIVSQTFVCGAGKDYTVVLQGRTDVTSFHPGLLQFEDTSINRCPIDLGMARLRFCHVAPGCVPIDVGATVLNADNYIYVATQLEYGTCSGEVLLTASAYSFIALTSGSNTYSPLQSSGNTFLIQSNHVYNLYFVGSATQASTPLTFVAENAAPCANPTNFEPVPAPRVPGTTAGNGQFVPFTAPGPDVAPYQPRLRPPPHTPVPIIYGPRQPIVFAGASQLLPPGAMSASLVAAMLMAVLMVVPLF